LKAIANLNPAEYVYGFIRNLKSLVHANDWPSHVKVII